MKPFLLLDVDGVLCPFSEQPGYEMLDDSWVSKANADRLAQLKERFDLVWATSWEHEANKWLAEYHGLLPLPVITFMPKFSRYEEKLYDIIEFVRDNPFAWIDDAIGWQAEEYAANREVPMLLIRTDPMIGITDEDVVKLLDFAKEVTDETGPGS